MQPVEEIETKIQSDAKRFEQGWRNLFEANCNALFQTALLLTADAQAAEAAVVDSVNALDTSRPPEEHSLAGWQQAVVIQSIETSQPSSSTVDPTTRLMLQPGLLPVIHIERSPRICFVLRMLLGYTTTLCAQMLGVEESRVRMLFQMAVLQLQQKIVTNRIPP